MSARLARGWLVARRSSVVQVCALQKSLGFQTSPRMASAFDLQMARTASSSALRVKT